MDLATWQQRFSWLAAWEKHGCGALREDCGLLVAGATLLLACSCVCTMDPWIQQWIVADGCCARPRVHFSKWWKLVAASGSLRRVPGSGLARNHRQYIHHGCGGFILFDFYQHVLLKVMIFHDVSNILAHDQRLVTYPSCPSFHWGHLRVDLVLILCWLKTIGQVGGE